MEKRKLLHVKLHLNLRETESIYDYNLLKAIIINGREEEKKRKIKKMVDLYLKVYF